MRRSFRWFTAVGCGLLVGAVTLLLTDGPDFAIGTAIVYVLATDLSIRSNERLQAHPDWEETPVDSYWMMGLLLLVVLPLSFVERALELSRTNEELTILLFVTGIALGGLAAGIGLTVAGLDDGDSQSSTSEMGRRDADENAILDDRSQ